MAPVPAIVTVEPSSPSLDLAMVTVPPLIARSPGADRHRPTLDEHVAEAATVEEEADVVVVPVVPAMEGSTTTDGQGGGMGDDGSLLTISGGTLLVNAEGDGLDSNGKLVVTGGTTVISGPTNNGNGALDAGGGITVTGGTVVAAGASGMAERPGTESTTGWVAVAFSQAIAAGQTISIVSDGAVIASYTTVKEAASIVVADPDLTSGKSYDVYVGGALAGTTVGTYSDSGDVSGATKNTTVTAGTALAGGMGGGRGPR